MKWTILLSLIAVSWSQASDRVRIVPDVQKAQCHLMKDSCPVGWHEKVSDQTRKADSEDAWVECCQNDGEFVPLPPQPHEKTPVCNPKSRDEWLALGIEFEEGCDLRYSTCAIKYEPEESQPPSPPAAELPPPPPPAKRRAPPAPPARVKLVARDGDNPHRPQGDVQSLVAGLKAEASADRERAALGLASLGTNGAAALEALVSLMQGDSSARVRACAVVAIACVARSNGDAIPFLRKALSDPDRKVRAVAAQALKALAGEAQHDRPKR